MHTDVAADGEKEAHYGEGIGYHRLTSVFSRSIFFEPQ